MSTITSFILATSISEEKETLKRNIEIIENSIIKNSRSEKPVFVDASDLKFCTILKGELFIASVRNCYTDDVIQIRDVFKTLIWDEPDDIQLLVKIEEPYDDPEIFINIFDVKEKHYFKNENTGETRSAIATVSFPPVPHLNSIWLHNESKAYVKVLALLPGEGSLKDTMLILFEFIDGPLRRTVCKVEELGSNFTFVNLNK